MRCWHGCLSGANVVHVGCGFVQLTLARSFHVLVCMSLCLSVMQYTLAVMNIGSPSCGMNAASRGFVRLALTRGCRVLGIRFGFEGLVQDNVIIAVFPLYALISVKCNCILYVAVRTSRISWHTCCYIIRPHRTCIAYGCSLLLHILWHGPCVCQSVYP